MEIMLHYMYVGAIKDTKAWAGDSAFQLAMIGFFSIHVMWLKVPQNILPIKDETDCTWSVPVADTVAVLSALGASGWDRPAGEYDPLCFEQLFRP